MIDIKIRKKDNSLQDYNPDKIKIAVSKSAQRAMYDLSDVQKDSIVTYVEAQITRDGIKEIPIIKMHSMVEAALEKVAPEVAKSYRDYRDYKVDFVAMLDEVYKKSQSIMYIGDKDNANTDSALVATKRSLVFNAFNKELYKKFFLTRDEIQACNDGYIYVHDMSARRDTMNCCLFNIKNVLSGGFEMGNVWYNEPKTLDTAFDVIGDITMAAASQQYGGFTLPEIDKVLAKYAKMTYEKQMNKYLRLGLSEDGAKVQAWNDTEEEMKQGYQGWEYKFNTVGSSRGDYPFITISFGLGTDKFEKLASRTILRVHKGGQGKKDRKIPVLFPKLVFIYTKELHGVGMKNEDLFEEAIACSAKTMYPDYLSLDGDNHVGDMWRKYGKVVSPMGCVDGKEIITYKWNEKLFVESFERLWNRFSDRAIGQRNPNDPNMFVDVRKDNIKIWDTEKGFVKVTTLIRNLSDQWNNVKLSNGRSVLCTKDHPFETITRGVVTAENLLSSDRIRINSAQYYEENEIIDDSYAWGLGLILCDGKYINSSIVVSIADHGEDEIEEKFKEFAYKYFGAKIKTTCQNRGKEGVYKDLCFESDTRYCLNSIGKQFADLFGGYKKINRQIPNCVFSWNYSAKMSFLAGMIDADGYINDTSHGGSIVQIGSTNKELALGQAALARTLDMPARVYENTYNKSKPLQKRTRVEFFCSMDLSNYVTCKKKTNKYKKESHHKSLTLYPIESKVLEVIPVNKSDYSYDVSTESEHFEVSGIYSHNCRAFLSPWYERGGMTPADDDDTPVFEGRFNIGAVSLHLPMILAKARHEGRDFYEVLDQYLEMIRQLHIRTYAYLGEMRASTNPLAYCEGGFYGGNLQPGDKIKPLLKSATASFGITALNELQELYNGKSIVEDGEFALEVLKYINEKVQEYKRKDDRLYAIYGTPAESLCGLQITQFRKLYGIIENVSDRPYVSNSFHCHVTEDISPIRKQDLEHRFWNLSAGGRIQYVRYPIGYNVDAIRSLVRRAMEMGFYEGVNLALAYCNDCGHQELEMDTCPVCGSKNLTKIDRMNGYLAYSRVKGASRLNDAKMAEIAERKSM